MKFVKKTATQSTTKTETDMETWDFDDLAVGTTFARDDKITNSNGASLVLDVRETATQLRLQTEAALITVCN